MPKDLISIEWERWDPSLQTVKVSLFAYLTSVWLGAWGGGVRIVSRIAYNTIAYNTYFPRMP